MDQFAKETLPISLEDEMRRSYLDYEMCIRDRHRARIRLEFNPKTIDQACDTRWRFECG